MILIFEETTGEIIGADKELLQKYSIEELNEKFSTKIDNLDELQSEEEYKDYNIESIPVKDYKIIFFIKENNSLIPDIPISDDSSITSDNTSNELSFDFGNIVPNEVENNTPQPKEESTSDNSFNLDSLLNDSLSTNNDPDNKTSDELSLDFGNIVPNEVENNTPQPKEEESTSDNSFNLDSLLNDSLSTNNDPNNKTSDELSLDFGNIVPNEVENNTPPQPKEESTSDNSFNLDSLLNDSLSTNNDPNNKTSDELSLDFGNIVPNEVENNTPPQPKEESTSDNSFNLDSLLNDSLSTNNDPNNKTSDELSLDFGNIVPNEVENNTPQPKEEESTSDNSSFNLDSLLNDSLSTNDSDNNNTSNESSVNFSNINNTPQLKEEESTDDNSSFNLDNLLNEHLSTDDKNSGNTNIEYNNSTNNNSNEKKVIHSINFDIESIKKKKQGNS